MDRTSIQLTVYGAEIKCASCVNAPGSKETFEWLQAAITRKYGNEGITYQYFDIHSKDQEGMDEEVLKKIYNDELFYPLVLIEGEVVGEGNPRLKRVYQALESHGLQQADS